MERRISEITVLEGKLSGGRQQKLVRTALVRSLIIKGSNPETQLLCPDLWENRAGMG